MSYTCKHCSSPEVEYLDWVDLNSGEPVGDELHEYFCRGCDSPTEVVFVDDEQPIVSKPIENE